MQGVKNKSLHDRDASPKRRKIFHQPCGRLAHALPGIQHPVLNEYYDRVVHLRSWLVEQDVSKRCKRRIATLSNVANIQSLKSSNSINSIRLSQDQESGSTLCEQISLLLNTAIVAVNVGSERSSTALPNHCSTNAPIATAKSITTADENGWNRDFLRFSQLTSTASSAQTNETDVASKHSTVCSASRHARCCKYSASLCL